MTLSKAYMVVGNVYVNRDRGTAFDKQLALDPERTFPIYNFKAG